MARESALTSWQRAIITISYTCVGLVIVLALYWGRPVLVPIALAILLTFILNPIVRRLQRLGLGRLLSVILAVSSVGICVTSIGLIGSRQITNLLSELPANTAKITAKVKSLKAVVSGPSAQRFEQMLEEISREFQSAADTTLRAAALSEADEPATTRPATPLASSSERIPWRMLTGYLGSAVEVLATIAFALVLLVFFLLEREGFRDRLVLLAGKTHLTLTSKALEDATDRVSRYIVMLAIVNGGFGLLMAAGLFLLGMPYAVLWGCLAALLRFVPYIGPWVGAAFPLTMSLAMSEGWWQPLAVFGYVMTLELVTNNVVEPLLFGRTTGVAPTALLISAAFWLFLWGPIGLILSAPFAVCLVVLGKNIPQLRFLNLLLGDEPALSANEGFYQRLLIRDHHEAASLIVSRFRESESDHVFDDLLIPALNYARRDFQRGYLTVAERDSLLLALCDSFSAVDLHRNSAVAEDSLQHDGPLNGHLHAQAVTERPKRLKLIGCAAVDELDRTALAMLQELLDPTHWDVELLADKTLTSELVARVLQEAPAAICIAAVPPGGIAHARYLCKKLRSGGADVPLIVGRWGPRRISAVDNERLAEAGATVVTTTLLETRQWLESRHCLFKQPTSIAAEPTQTASCDSAVVIPI